MRSSIALPLGVVLGLVFALVSWIITEPGFHRHLQEQGFITYPQQRQDKELCERDIKRSQQCTPVIMWLPEAED